MLHQKFPGLILFVALLAAPIAAALARAGKASKQSEPRVAQDLPPWQTPARLRHLLGSTRGMITFGADGIVFRPLKGKPQRWSFIEIHTFRVTRHELTLRSYRNRAWHLPGEESFRFALSHPVPPAVAAKLAESVGKPSENSDPNPSLPSFAVIPARHSTALDGTNGDLRFRQAGIDYVTSSKHGSRSWRWADIQTIARPDPYHFRVGGYRETFDFELKRPMSRVLFDRLWDYQYGRGLHLGVQTDQSQNRSGLAQTGMDDER
ncbi:MAG TPA: hypothetical protein VKV79_06965 [Terriglobia bacterium]|nr:hypothetical protein [Terriglobia bacterium]